MSFGTGRGDNASTIGRFLMDDDVILRLYSEWGAFPDPNKRPAPTEESIKDFCLWANTAPRSIGLLAEAPCPD